MKVLWGKAHYYIRKSLATGYERFVYTEHLFTLLMALLIGVLAGFGTILIRFLIKTISDFAFIGNGSLLERVIETPWYLKLLIPALGGAIVGPIIHFWAGEAKRSGVPEVILSVISRGGYIRPRVALIKAIATSITIGTGGSVGREGPIVQIGSSIGSSIGQFFKVSNQRLKTFVGCGAAAGIAAAFNAPIAGTLFAVEIILQDFAFAQFSPIVISSVMATVISHGFEGNFAAFQVPVYHLTSYYELILYFIMALIISIVAFSFIKSLYFFEDVFEKNIPIPDYLKPSVGGLLIGAIAIFSPEVIGIGYESINHALHGNLLIKAAAILIVVKIISTSITMGSGASGGVFAPSLFLGAMTGVLYGTIVHHHFPNITSEPGAYALVAMGGIVSAVTHAPITAIIMIFELTNNYTIILPLMITCIISTLITSTFNRESIYTLNLVRRNIHIRHGTEIDAMKSIFVKDVYSRTFETLQSSMKFDEVVNRLLIAKDPYYPVINPEGRLSGMISLQDIKEYLYEKEYLQDLLIADDIASKDVIVANLEDDCQSVLDQLRKSSLQGIPVVDKNDQEILIGMIWRKDIFSAYNQEVERRDLASTFASKIKTPSSQSTVHFMEGYSIAEIPVPTQFVGKSVRNLNIRNNYGVDIILLRKSQGTKSKIAPVPSADYVFKNSDQILILGPVGSVNKMKSI